MLRVVVAEKLLDLNQKAKKLVEDAESSEFLRCEKVAGDEIPLLKYHMPGGSVLEEDVYRHVSSDSCIVLSLALRDQNGNWIEESKRPLEGLA